MVEDSSPFFPLDPLYLNERRIAALMGVQLFANELASFAGWNDKRSQHLRSLRCAEVLGDWIKQFGKDIPSFHAACVTTKIRPRMLFTYEGTLWSRNALAERPGVGPLAYAKLQSMGPAGSDLRLHLLLHPDHVVVGSAGRRLKGQLADIFVLAQVEQVCAGLVEAVPIFIGYLGEYKFMGDFFPAGRNEVFVDSIENFDAIRDVPPPSAQALSALREIPERDIKVAFAQIIGEADVPKDWGGERSDLYTTYLRVSGRRISTAFMFKGAAGGQKFREMQIADLGKNGDQVERLCNEPADMLVVQHCNKIGGAVRNTVRAFCNQVGRQRRYCLIPGADTLRVLKAYGKCGL
ncbi:MAG: hypothetical protein WDO69_33445 [Pseudomonadota bacterium]